MGTAGNMGPKGDPGEPGVPGMDAFGTNAVYTIWGSTTCPPTMGTVRLTQGLAASPYHYDEGGASNYMCLPNAPSFLKGAGNNVHSKVVGVKYATANEPLEEVDGEAMPCAVCSTTQSVQLMIPGRAVCPDNSRQTWRQEYRGYLMSARDTDSNGLPKGDLDSHFRTKYICVDSTPEGASSGTAAEAAIYHVHVDCTNGASLQCGTSSQGIDGYNTMTQITCVVCTLTPETPIP